MKYTRADPRVLPRIFLPLCLGVLAVAGGPVARAGAHEHSQPRVPLDSLRAHPELGPDSGVELIGRPAREFRFSRWLRTAPLTPDSLRGKVVLIRFWTDDCRFCRNTLPAVEKLRERFAPRGLVVLGAYHPNEPGAVSDSLVLAWASRYGFGGPIAVDDQWATLRHWWLDGHPDRNWVSVSFLLDRDGIVRWVHGGGEYHPSGELLHRSCDVSYRELDRKIEELLR
ncbi:MAG: redoxin domain-containing protein [Candidatus Eisenbacteria bacterium]|nr:redoxin domain-containing protein [Candidatus Eisenbacteria bacterium]